MNLSPLPVQKFFGNDGKPLVGGLLFTYEAGISIKVATYTDSTGATQNTNPVVLDFRGECRLWIDPTQAYKYVLSPPGDTDPPTKPIWTVDNITAGPASADNAANDTGSVNNIILSIPQISSPVAFTRIVFKVANTNTGAVTISVNGGTAKALTWQSAVDLSGYEVVAGGVYEAIYDATQWQLQGPTLAPGDIRLYGGKGDGSTDDTAALREWAASARPGSQLRLAPNGTYMFDPAAVLNGVLFSGAAGFSVYGNGSTIKCVPGASVVAQHEMMRFNNCQDVYIENITVDADRASRTPVESTTHNININSNCQRMLFKKCIAANAVTDGWYVGTDSGGSQVTYPTDIVLDDCIGVNAFRNNLSIIASVRMKVKGGRYTSANGTSPQDGIDVEPDVTDTSGNQDLVIEDVEVSGNIGYGLSLAGPGGPAMNTRVVLSNIRGSGNTAGLMAIANVNGLDVDAVHCGPHAASTRGVIDIQSGNVTDVSLRNLNFRGVTINSSSRWLLYNFGTNGRLQVNGFRAYDCPNLPAVLSSGLMDMSDVLIQNTTDLGIFIGGNTSTLRNVTVNTATGRAVYIDGDNVTCESMTLIDCLVSSSNAFTVAPAATGAIIRNANVIQTASIPASAVGFFFGEAPAVVQNCYARSAGTDFTAANAFNFSAGTTGSFIDGLTPGGQLFQACVLSPTQIAGNTNDYAPTNLQGAAILRLSTDASRNLTGLTGGAPNRKITIFNIGSFDLVLTDNDVASAADNRFLLGANVIVGTNEGISLWYDGSSTKWRASGRST